MSALPFAHEPGDIELLWPRALDGDPACRFVRDAMSRIAAAQAKRVHKQLRPATTAVAR